MKQDDQMDEEPIASTAPEPAAFADTRRRLHGIGECLMAGPQRHAGGRITLRVTPGGFATTGDPALRLDGADVVGGETKRVAVAGTFADLAEALGVDFAAPADGYPGRQQGERERRRLAGHHGGTAHPGLASAGGRGASTIS